MYNRGKCPFPSKIKTISWALDLLANKCELIIKDIPVIKLTPEVFCVQAGNKKEIPLSLELCKTLIANDLIEEVGDNYQLKSVAAKAIKLFERGPISVRLQRLKKLPRNRYDKKCDKCGKLVPKNTGWAFKHKVLCIEHPPL